MIIMLPKEKDFEELIENSLLSLGYEKGSSSEFDLQNNLFLDDLFRFLENTQKEKLDEFKLNRGNNWEKEFINGLNSDIDRRGLIDVLRNGYEDCMMNGKFELFFNKPNTTDNKSDYEKYTQNIFKVTRQLKYSPKHNNTLDMVISLNGFPVIAMELKNQFTGQNVFNAIEQFKKDRDPKEEMFKFNRRVLVYFALDTDEVYMTTRLKGNSTFFLPFNRGNNRGKGNPEIEGKLKTSYLWEDILAKDSLLDILKRFYFIEKDKQNKAIFPRFHQLDAVRKIVEDVKKNKVGKNYLIQHSAGSGKTNTIAWTAHRLSSLHDENNEAIFDSVIVVTDRKVLDKQLQDAVYQLEHKHGLVVKIDDNKNSSDLAEAIMNRSKIIITTIQKFKYALEKIDSLEKRKYAVIIDEAHSSTSGENMNALKETLAGKSLEEAEKISEEEERKEKSSLDKMTELIEKRTNTDKISFFAFTATPKNKTMQVFGRIGADGKPHEFHLYSMKQAIEEGFILDVLKNFMTAKVYYKIGKSIADNPELDKSEGKKAVGRFVNLNNYNIRKKVETIVDDFAENRSMWINGKAKAMIVTSSRLHAVRYKLAVDQYIKEKGYDFKALVAFSGTVNDDDVEYTEVGMNSDAAKDINESNLPSIFDRDEFKILIVADKYQTGFDQPKLCAMYVDKKLDGVKTVQTLSRLNRTYPNKRTFILDFQNSVEDIQEAYKPYFEMTNIDEVTDTNLIVELFWQLREYGIFDETDVNKFADLYYTDNRSSEQDIMMNNIIDSGVYKYREIEEESEEEADEFKKKSRKFVSMYNFLIQVYPMKNLNFLRLRTYLSALIKKLPKKHSERLDLDDMLTLDYYKIKKMGKDDVTGEDISLHSGEGELRGLSERDESSVSEKQEEYLDDIIKKVNEIYGKDLTEDDRIALNECEDELKNDPDIVDIAKANSFEDWEKVFEDRYFNKAFFSIKKKNSAFAMDMLRDRNLKSFMIHHLASVIYRYVNK